MYKKISTIKKRTFLKKIRFLLFININLLMNARNKMNGDFFVPVPGVNHCYYAGSFVEMMDVEPVVLLPGCYASFHKDVPLQPEYFY